MDLNTVQLLAIEYAIAVMSLFLGYKCLSLKKENMDYFKKFVAVMVLFGLVNIPIRYVELHLVNWNRFFVFCLYASSVIVMTYTMAYWFMFVLKQINSKAADSKNKVLLCMLPAAGTIPLCIINYWTGWLYVIDESSWYTRGSIFILQAAISYGYFFVCIIINVYSLFASKDNVARKCIFAIVPAIFGAALQIMYGGSYLLLGTVFGGWIMYVEICLDRQKAYELSEAVSAINDELMHSNREISNNMRTILALADIYHTLYEVDLENDTFTEIKAMPFVSKYCSKFKSARECLEKIPGTMFAAGYVEAMKTVFEPDAIKERLRNNNSYYIDAVGRHSKDWVRATIIVAERDAEGEVARFVFTFQGIGDIIEQQKKLEEVEIYEGHAREMKELFVQTAGALASAIDAKDRYTHGHSRRVATYARKIAEEAGMSETECEKIYFAGLLHDVGKIGVPDTIICKAGKLTDDEYAAIKLHPVHGQEILDKIERLPYLSIGANYHHERYDGKGYPSGLKGNGIPEMARIIAVADAYDAMTSKRSYRNPIPQQTVREEIVKGMETQFDPEFAKIMVHLIDKDIEFQMQERVDFNDDTEDTELSCKEYRSEYSESIRVNEKNTKIYFNYESTGGENSLPAFVIFDALDARIHKGDAYEKLLSYHEYGELKINGEYIFDGVRCTQIEVTDISNYTDGECAIELVKDNDHMYFEMKACGRKMKATLCLPDNTRYVYVSITGENCEIHDITYERAEEAIPEGTITRIADEISYLNGLEGDIPSIQVDGWRTATTDGILLDGDKKITFEMSSLPFARLIWHCPFIVIFHSDDGKVYGKNYREYGVIRLNGESWSEYSRCENYCLSSKTADFPGWDQWKLDNIAGRKSNILIYKSDNQIVLKTENGGIEIENTTIINDGKKEIYLAFSGDQCTVENIHIYNGHD
ncbi:MAG: HD domain-containing protein [Lachnospiraceae bacterium]|nr:HD domain-containing protein [Lachnospiraceae bacterium]